MFPYYIYGPYDKICISDAAPITTKYTWSVICLKYGLLQLYRLYLTSAFGEAFSVSEPEDWLLSWQPGLASSKFDSKLSAGTSSVDSHFPSLHCALSWTFSRWTLNSTFRWLLKSHRSQQKYKYLWNSKASSWFAVWILLLSCNKWAAHHMHSQKIPISSSKFKIDLIFFTNQIVLMQKQLKQASK